MPVEVVPFALGFCRRQAGTALGCRRSPAKTSGDAAISDNGNPILDCRSALDDPAGLERAILPCPGVVDTGLFLDMARDVIVGDGDSVQVLAGVAI